jgi:hypothetical protein
VNRETGNGHSSYPSADPAATFCISGIFNLYLFAGHLKKAELVSHPNPLPPIPGINSTPVLLFINLK